MQQPHMRLAHALDAQLQRLGFASGPADGFRPGRSAHQAVAQAQRYIAEGYGWVVDLDLEKVFDRVNHDKLMGQIANRVEDKRLLKLIRAFLNAGVMEMDWSAPAWKALRKEAHFRRCCPTWCSTNSTES